MKVEEFAAGATTPAATSTYKYDGRGRRIEKVGNGITRRYIYDGEDILLEYDETNTLLARYTHGPGIDEPVAMTRGGSTYFYHQDGLGSVTDLTDSTASPVKTYSYDAWGDIVQQTGTVENPYTYTGREFDTESGLYYYRARYYDPRSARFLQEDPIGFAGGDLNLYLYVKGDPVNKVDQLGLACCDAKLPGSPINEVALTCFAEASPNCAEGAREKRAITDTVFNRQRRNDRTLGGSDILNILGYPGQYLGYKSTRYKKAENPSGLDPNECQQLKDCIAAAQASSVSADYSYLFFNQTSRPGRSKICDHYFFTEWPLKNRRR